MNRYILKLIVTLNLAASAFASSPASAEDVLKFRTDQGIKSTISSRLSSCGGFDALALFRVAADALSGEGDARTAVQSYFGRDYITALTGIVQAVRLGRGYADGLRSDMNVPPSIMDGYRTSLNTIGEFISNQSEQATQEHIQTTQAGANFADHFF